MRRSRIVRLHPPAWGGSVDGWFPVPSSDIPAGTSVPYRKLFSFLQPNAQYVLMGKVMALGDEVKVYPVVDWFYSELLVTLPTDNHASELIAKFMNDEERLTCRQKNTEGRTVLSEMLWSNELQERITERTLGNFCWLLTGTKQTREFMDGIYLQWLHRADYLVSRKSREKLEFRPDLSMTQVMQEGRERKRRMQRRVAQEKLHKEEIRTGKKSAWDTTVTDVLPREVRDMMDNERTGMEGFRITGSNNGTSSKSSHPNYR